VAAIGRGAGNGAAGRVSAAIEGAAAPSRNGGSPLGEPPSGNAQGTSMAGGSAAHGFA